MPEDIEDNHTDDNEEHKWDNDAQSFFHGLAFDDKRYSSLIRAMPPREKYQTESADSSRVSSVSLAKVSAKTLRITVEARA